MYPFDQTNQQQDQQDQQDAQASDSGDYSGIDQDQEADMARPYRALGYGERAVRRTCPACGDRHAALVNWRTWTLQCRRCGQSLVRPFLCGTGERRVRRASGGQASLPAPRAIRLSLTTATSSPDDEGRKPTPSGG